jgi:hypothetical protein
VTFSRNVFKVKFAVTVWLVVSGTWHVGLVPRGAQKPPQPVKVPPGTTDAVSVTVVTGEPTAKFALHESTQLVMPAGLLLTRPPGLRTLTVSVAPATKLAFTVRLADMTTVQAALPVQLPDQVPKAPVGPA